MAHFTQLANRITALLTRLAHRPVPVDGQLPYLVLDWPDAVHPCEQGYMADYEPLMRFIARQETSDLPGYERRNQEQRLRAERLGVLPQIYYGFSPDETLELGDESEMLR